MRAFVAQVAYPALSNAVDIKDEPDRGRFGVNWQDRNDNMNMNYHISIVWCSFLESSPFSSLTQVANRDIDVGEVLIVEEPVAAKVKQSDNKYHCGNCLRYYTLFMLSK